MSTNNKGFSLVELMASMVIMGVILMNLTAMMHNQNIASLKIQSEYDMATTLNDIGNLLSNPGNCKTNLLQRGTGTISLSPGTSTANGFIHDIGTKYYISGNPLAIPVGNSKLSIKNIALARSATGNIGTLAVDFTGKGLGSTAISKQITLNIVAAGSGEITDCNALGFKDSITAYGIKACPPEMVMIGTAGLRSTFCIDRVARGDAATTTYETAATTCSSTTPSAVGFDSLGTAHLCDYKEWFTACNLRNTPPAITFTPSGSSWEWISGPPTSTAIDAATPTPSTLLRMGATYTGNSVTLNPCITADTSALTTSTALYRCCFH